MHAGEPRRVAEGFGELAYRDGGCVCRDQRVLAADGLNRFQDIFFYPGLLEDRFDNKAAAGKRLEVSGGFQVFFNGRPELGGGVLFYPGQRARKSVFCFAIKLTFTPFLAILSFLVSLQF